MVATEDKLTQIAAEVGELGIWRFDPARRRVEQSTRHRVTHGLSPEGPASFIDDWILALHKEDRAKFLAALQNCLSGHADVAVDYRVVWRDSSEHRIESRGYLLTDPDGHPTAIVGVSRPIAFDANPLGSPAQKRTEILLAHALERADHDPLTGLLNHAAFQKRLAEHLSPGNRRGSIAVALIDIDGFRFFNDAYGHVAGDTVLQDISRVFRRAVRPWTYLARYGGDVFASLLVDSSPQAIDDLRGRIGRELKSFGYRPKGQNIDIPLAVSVGVAAYPGDARSRKDLLAAAEEDMRQTRAGRHLSGVDADHLRADLMRTREGFPMLNALVISVDNKDRYTRAHSEDVMKYSVEISRALGFSDREPQVIGIAALLHDVGKIAVPDFVLRKPGALTDEESVMMRQHPQMGAIMVGAVPGFEETLDAVRHHHERWDGQGYPFGLRGEEIPLSARLMAVADAYSAMTTDRPYRKGRSRESALTILSQVAGHSGIKVVSTRFWV